MCLQVYSHLRHKLDTPIAQREQLMQALSIQISDVKTLGLATVSNATKIHCFHIMSCIMHHCDTVYSVHDMMMRDAMTPHFSACTVWTYTHIRQDSEAGINPPKGLTIFEIFRVAQNNYEPTAYSIKTIDRSPKSSEQHQIQVKKTSVKNGFYGEVTCIN